MKSCFYAVLEVANNCSEPCPKLASNPEISFLLYNGACYYVPNCGSSCAMSYSEAQEFCDNAALGRRATLAHSVTTALMNTYLLRLLKAHYKANANSGKY